MKLLQDFGVTALLCTLVVIFVFILLLMGVYNGALDFNQLLPILEGWVGGILSAVVIIKAKKTQ